MWGDTFFTIVLVLLAMILPACGLWLMPRYFYADVEAVIR